MNRSVYDEMEMRRSIVRRVFTTDMSDRYKINFGEVTLTKTI